MIKKTLALYVASAAALGAVLTACGGPEAPRGPELPSQTATVAPEPRPEETHADRDEARTDLTGPIVEMVWGEMTPEDQMGLCMGLAVMTHDEAVAFFDKDLTAENREMLDPDRTVTLLQGKCDNGEFTTAT